MANAPEKPPEKKKDLRQRMKEEVQNIIFYEEYLPLLVILFLQLSLMDVLVYSWLLGRKTR